MKTVLIVNPMSADGSTGRQWDQLRRPILESFPNCEEVFTEARGDATEKTRQALKQGAELVIGIGGDGTNSEVIQGFFEPDGTPLETEAAFSFFPRGTGCDFRRFLKIPKDMAGAARAVAEAPTWAIDLARLDLFEPEPRHFHFLNISDFGIGGLISSRVNRSSKRFGGFFSFLWHSVVSLAIYEDQETELRFRELGSTEFETWRGTYRSVILANGQFFGGGMNINPLADLEDGALDLITLPDRGMFHYLRWFPRLYSSRGVLDHPEIHHRRVVELEARVTQPKARVEIEMDGENPGALPLRIRVLPKAIRIRAPRP